MVLIQVALSLCCTHLIKRLAMFRLLNHPSNLALWVKCPYRLLQMKPHDQVRVIWEGEYMSRGVRLTEKILHDHLQINHLHHIFRGGFNYFSRSTTQRNYQLKEDDFPPPTFSNEEGSGGGSGGGNDGVVRNYDNKPSHFGTFILLPHS